MLISGRGASVGGSLLPAPLLEAEEHLPPPPPPQQEQEQQQQQQEQEQQLELSDAASFSRGGSSPAVMSAVEGHRTPPLPTSPVEGVSTESAHRARPLQSSVPEVVRGGGLSLAARMAAVLEQQEQERRRQMPATEVSRLDKAGRPPPRMLARMEATLRRHREEQDREQQQQEQLQQHDVVGEADQEPCSADTSATSASTEQGASSVQPSSMPRQDREVTMGIADTQMDEVGTRLPPSRKRMSAERPGADSEPERSTYKTACTSGEAAPTRSGAEAEAEATALRELQVNRCAPSTTTTCAGTATATAPTPASNCGGAASAASADPGAGQGDGLPGWSSAGVVAQAAAPSSSRKRRKRKVYKPSFAGEAPAVEDGGFALFVDKNGRTVQ
eukprot:COSAG01_NODE_4436_length_5025_cov_3.808161_1_plen_388_part_00